MNHFFLIEKGDQCRFQHKKSRLSERIDYLSSYSFCQFAIKMNLFFDDQA